MEPRKETPLVRSSYELLRWCLPVVNDLPRSHRYSLGEDLEHGVVQMLRLALAASFGRDNELQLSNLQLEVDVLRYVVRALHEEGHLPGKKYGGFCDRMMEIGKQVGGWRKHAAKRRSGRSS